MCSLSYIDFNFLYRWSLSLSIINKWRINLSLLVYNGLIIIKYYVPCWFLPLLHQDYSIIGQLLSLLHFSFPSAPFFLSLISVYYSSLFCSRKLKGFISLAAHTPAPLQMTGALPPVTVPALCSFTGAGLQHGDEENTPAQDFISLCYSPTPETPLCIQTKPSFICVMPQRRKVWE